METGRGVNLVEKTGGCGSGSKNWGVVSPNSSTAGGTKHRIEGIINGIFI